MQDASNTTGTLSSSAACMLETTAESETKTKASPTLAGDNVFAHPKKQPTRHKFYFLFINLHGKKKFKLLSLSSDFLADQNKAMWEKCCTDLNLPTETKFTVEQLRNGFMRAL